MNVHYDQKHGLGAVPHNQDVKYFGFKCWMVPDMFLRLAKKIYIDPQDARFLSLQNLIKHGKPIGSPFLDCEWDIAKKVWTVWDHEGRHRVQAIKNLWPNEPIEVHIFPGSGIRARDISPEMLQSFMTGIIAQDKTYVKKPTSEIEWQGKNITPQAGAQTTPPPVFETQYQKSKREIDKFEKIGPHARKMQEYFGIVKKDHLTGRSKWIRETVEKPPIEKRLSNAHDKLYNQFQKILNKEKPCQFDAQGHCAGTRAGGGGYYGQPKVACCAGCKHHDPEKGCTTHSLGCKGWTCHSMWPNLSKSAQKQWSNLQSKAYTSGMSGIRDTKDQEIKHALSKIKWRIADKRRKEWIRGYMSRHPDATPVDAHYEFMKTFSQNSNNF